MDFMRTVVLLGRSVCVVAAFLLTCDSASISYDGKSFLLDGKRIFIFSGELHYWRVPEEEWAGRIRRLKAAGLNTISTCVPWALHETKPGEIDLTDFENLLNLCKQEGVFVVARIGPAIGADLEFNGLPYWLIARQSPDVDRDGELYLRYAARWYNAVCSLVARHQATKGGPIILVQIDHEYENTLGKPSSGDPSHLRTLASAARERGIEVPLYINYRLWPPADIRGVLLALDTYPGSDCDSVSSALSRQREKWPDRPVCVSEFSVFRDYSTIGMAPVPAPDNLAAAYRGNVHAMLSSGACLINHYTAGGMWNFAYSRRRDLGSVYYPNAPLTVTGGFGGTYFFMRLVGQWLDSFGSGLLTAQRLPLEAVEIIPAESAGSTSERKGAGVAAEALASDGALYIFIREKQGKANSIGLQVRHSAMSQALTIPKDGHIPLSPRQSKILVAGIKLGDATLLYSTSEILTRGSLGGIHYAVFYGEPGTPGEIALTTSQPPSNSSKSIRVTSDGGVPRVNYVHSPEDQFVRIGKTIFAITTRERAARTWRVGQGDQSALLITDADFLGEPESTTTGVEADTACKPGECRVSALLATQPEQILLDGRKIRFSTDEGICRFNLETPSAPTVSLRLKRAKFASEAALPEGNAPWAELNMASALAQSGVFNPGFIRLRASAPREAIKSLSVKSNATPPHVLHVNQKPVLGSGGAGGEWVFGLDGRLNKAANELVLTLEFETVPELKISTSPEMDLRWEASPGLKGEWQLLFARPDGPEWQSISLPEKPPASDIGWYAMPFTLHPKPGWEQPLLLKVEAGDEALLWFNVRKFVRYTSRGPEKAFPLPSSWLLGGQNLLVIAARGGKPVSAEIASDDDHSLMHHKLELKWSRNR